jgi:Arc/MetJ-type ribon-helix-helix transcriptional regulator
MMSRVKLPVGAVTAVQVKPSEITHISKNMVMKETKTTVVQTEIPEGLLVQAQTLVEAGWFRNLDELILHALRRFLESHQADLMEEFIRQDVEWGLRGNEFQSVADEFYKEINP